MRKKTVYALGIVSRCIQEALTGGPYPGDAGKHGTPSLRTAIGDCLPTGAQILAESYVFNKKRFRRQNRSHPIRQKISQKDKKPLKRENYRKTGRVTNVKLLVYKRKRIRKLCNTEIATTGRLIEKKPYSLYNATNTAMLR